ncbi:MAG: hypothetical protein QNJ14_09375 [Woeseiaceae bacterium]|nr:hypothetical protein [Woeseiaceae bacterium]
MISKKRILGIGAALLASIALAGPANATLILELSDGDETVTVSDWNENGAVLFVGSIGDWVLNVTLGASNPLIGDERTARLDLSSLNITGNSQTGGVLTIRLTNTGIVAPHGDTNYLVEIGGTTNGQVSFQSYADSSNEGFGTGTLLHDTGIIGSGAFAHTGYGGVSVVGPYSLTTVATVDHSHGFSLTGFNHSIEVAEPAGLALLGIGLLGLAFGMRRRA